MILAESGHFIDFFFEDMAGPKTENAARINWNLFAGFRVAPHATVFMAHQKGAERRKFDIFTPNEGIGNFV